MKDLIGDSSSHVGSAAFVASIYVDIIIVESTTICFAPEQPVVFL